MGLQRPLVSIACLVMSFHLLRSWAKLFSSCSPVLHQLTMSSIYSLHGLPLIVALTLEKYGCGSLCVGISLEAECLGLSFGLETLSLGFDLYLVLGHQHQSAPSINHIHFTV